MSNFTCQMEYQKKSIRNSPLSVSINNTNSTPCMTTSSKWCGKEGKVYNKFIEQNIYKIMDNINHRMQKMSQSNKVEKKLEETKTSLQ